VRLTSRLVILLAVVASLLSFAKFSHCEKSVWGTPDQFIHACYSDIPSLYGSRHLDTGLWAYGNGKYSIEYPVIQGTVMWATAKVIPHGVLNYFNGNALLLVLLFILISFITFKIKPEYSYLLPLAPAGIASLYINWDLWGIISMMAAIYWFDRRRDTWSAIALGISIATKFMPIFLLIPIAVIFLRQQRITHLLKYYSLVALTFTAINLPVYLTTPDGWWRFYKMNLERGSDWGSVWYALSSLGADFTHQNYLSVLAVLIAATITILALLQCKEIPTLAGSAFIILAMVLAVSKVYSPQYVLWLIPLAVLALNRELIPYFWAWQIAEVIYHLAIWQHLALVSGSHFGLPLKAYAIATLIRIAASLALVAKIIHSQRNPALSEREFLFKSAEIYP
jgi:uncharacterized membrane protein